MGLSQSNKKSIAITGEPGCGKTYVIKQIIEKFNNKKQQIYGIITEDICDEETGKRQGFYLKNINTGTTDTLAKKKEDTTDLHGIDKYEVNINNINQMIENLEIQISKMETGSILVIDEIGRMELMSEKFQKFIIKLFNEQRDFKLLVTIPIKREDIVFFQENDILEKLEIITLTTWNEQEQKKEEIIEKLQ